MSNFSNYLSKIHYSPALPDWTQLGDRLFLVDGVNPNLVMDGWPEHTRIMGMYPQQTAPVLALSDAGTPAALEDGETYRYGVTRVMKIGSLVVESSLISDTLENDAGATRDGSVTLIDYEYPPGASSTWELYYRVYRSKKESTTMLYLAAELTEAEYDALTAGEYIDTKTDANLDTSYKYNFEATETNMFLPPVRYIRAWQGRLMAGGGQVYSVGTATASSGSDTITLNSPGQAKEVDRNAWLWLDGEDRAFTIEDVDEDANTLTVDRNTTAAHSEVAFAIWRDSEVLYALEPLPGNIEGGDLTGTGMIYTNLGAGGELRGIAVSSDDFCYIMRSNSVEHVEGAAPDFQLVRKLQGIGCASHATIADRYSPRVIWYAGRAGVWQIVGGEAQRISAPVDPIIEDEVDHSMDHRTHGVYDPQTNRYYLWLFGSDWADYTVQVPQLLLIWDAGKNEWYRGEMAASISGLQRRADGSLGPVVGLAGGTAWLDEDTAYDGENIASTATGSGNSTLSDTATDFDTYTNLAGLPVHVTADSGGPVQRRIIKSVSGNTVTIYGTWDTNPAAGDAYHVGTIRYHAETAEMEYVNVFDTEKKVHRAFAVVDPDTETNVLTMKVKGVREHSARAYSRDQDMNGAGVCELKGAGIGLRARSATVRFEGDSARPVKILSTEIEAADTRRA